jgi:hypothetical protein
VREDECERGECERRLGESERRPAANEPTSPLYLSSTPLLYTSPLYLSSRRAANSYTSPLARRGECERRRAVRDYSPHPHHILDTRSTKSERAREKDK